MLINSVNNSNIKNDFQMRQLQKTHAQFSMHKSLSDIMYQKDSVNFNHSLNNISFGGILGGIKNLFSGKKDKDGIAILPPITERKAEKQKQRQVKNNVKELKKLISNSHCTQELAEQIWDNVTEDNVELAVLLFKKYGYWNSSYLPDVLKNANAVNLNLAKKLSNDADLYDISRFLFRATEKTTKYLEYVYDNKPHLRKYFHDISWCFSENQDDRDFNFEFVKKVIDFSEKIINKKAAPEISIKIWGEEMPVQRKKPDLTIIGNVSPSNIDFAKELWKVGDYADGVILNIIALTDRSNLDEAKTILERIKKGEIEERMLMPFLKKTIDYKNYKMLQHRIGRNNVKKLQSEDLAIACKIPMLAGIKNINEVRLADKRKLLKNLMQSVHGKYRISSELKQYFPLAPTNTREYCKILPSIISSLGIQTRKLFPNEINEFNQTINELGQILASLPVEEFANLRITQDFSKEDFIREVLSRISILPNSERQKIYDYFGFEIHHDKNTKSGYSIIGYPLNSKNEEKLSLIKNEDTRCILEEVRPLVVRFSENNHINVNNPQVEVLLNKIIEVLPELRTTIGRIQHGTHEFDVMQHSLKVMQKISQSAEFDTLNESDKKIILLSSLLHDITKTEAAKDKEHAENSSFDAFYISKKFNLSKEEEMKLYKLIKHHEWLGYANTASSKKHLEKRLQSIAFDLQQDNLFYMSLLFTHADLLAVKADESFHEDTSGDYRICPDKIRRSYGLAADFYGYKIDEYIDKLKATQPILPVTKFPTADAIRAKITEIHPDNSTNIKGVYINNEGLVVIKYNEVENWEDLGFPKGSISKGISAVGKVAHHHRTKDVDTGNIKFFVHGLDYENQLAKFDAFSLIDSDALLSVSYAERPESKFRFFRPQGVILDVDTNCVYGGGSTDSGSGYAKSISTFKHHYIFDGERKDDRKYISNLIKEATNMTDSEYTIFVKKNKNKSMLEIEPKEIQEKLIKAFSEMNSRIRLFDRQYNEMFVSNPRVMGVFVYDYEDNTIGNPIHYTNNKFTFLKQYALEKNIPLVVFGN